MKKDNLVRLLSLLMVLLMLPVISWAEEADPYGKYEDTVELTFLGTDRGNKKYDSTIPARKSAQENAWIDAYKEYLNIDLERITPEDETALNAVITTSLASGDLPDIMYVTKSLFYVLAENGVLADLSKVYEENAGPMVQEVVSTFPEAIETGYYDGQLLGFPVIKNVHDSNAAVLWIRQDWLNKVNMEAPKTMDDLYNVAKAFKDNKLGGENTYGIGIAGGIPEAIASAYGAVNNTWVKQEDGSYVYANTTAPMKKALAFMQKLYSEGLIRNDFAVSGTNINEDIANSLVGIRYDNATLGVLGIQTCYNNDPEADWICVRIPTETGEAVPQWSNKTVTEFLVVNAECENPEALFKMLELELHMYYEPTAEERALYTTCEDGYQMENCRAIRLFGKAAFNVAVCKEVIKGIETNAETVPAFASNQFDLVKQGLAGDRSLKGRAYVYTEAYSLVDELIQSGLLVGEYNGPTTENMTLYQNTINTALNNELLKIVMGGDVDDFDKAVATWYSSGGDKITQEVNEYYADR